MAEYIEYHPLKFWLDPASIAEIVAHIQTYLVNNPINSTTEIETIIHDYLIAHPELIGGVDSVNGQTGEVVLTADNISGGENVTIKDVLDSLQDQIDDLKSAIIDRTYNLFNINNDYVTSGAVTYVVDNDTLAVTSTKKNTLVYSDYIDVSNINNITIFYNAVYDSATTGSARIRVRDETGATWLGYATRDTYTTFDVTDINSIRLAFYGNSSSSDFASERSSLFSNILLCDGLIAKPYVPYVTAKDEIVRADVVELNDELKMSNNSIALTSESINKFYDDFFARGDLNNTNGEYIPTVAYRVATPKIITLPIDIVVEAKTGFRYRIQLFNNGAFVSDSGWKVSGVKTTINAGSEIKILIGRSSSQESSSEVADINTFVSSVAVSAVEKLDGTGESIYTGERVILSNTNDKKHLCNIELWKDFTSSEIEGLADYNLYLNQSMTIYDGYVFLFNNNGGGIVVDYETKTILSAFSTSPTTKNHQNSAQFTDLYYDNNDEFPLLLLSRCNGHAPNADNYDECLIYRVTRNGNSFTFTLVNSIYFSGVTYGASWGVDNTTRILFMTCYTNGSYSVTTDNPINVYAFAMPSLTDIMSGTEITLDEGNVIAHSITEYAVAQGICVHGGIVYSAVQLSGAKLWAIDVYANKIISKIPLLVNWEPEGVAVYSGKMYVSQKVGTDTAGTNPLRIYELVF